VRLKATASLLPEFVDWPVSDFAEAGFSFSVRSASWRPLANTALVPKNRDGETH
jgi:hypothetical protein